MMRRVIELPNYDWSIVCFIGYQPPDADEICYALSDIGCNGNPLSEAYEHLTKYRQTEVLPIPTYQKEGVCLLSVNVNLMAALSIQ